ncbi:beta-glucuronosyltransferase GlcAT14A-like [Phoenix dactylifera]|uniref:Beta-glucuronosyltransferase GlcAT14A-like n=1 Tax=Phoenix dactylifera TaxID=42345 RepID=A0A8B7CX44_PHODC|nr:beta-glucuronosyltransferase GlcAT14A-like [Phoenix dactylifera]
MQSAPPPLSRRLSCILVTVFVALLFLFLVLPFSSPPSSSSSSSSAAPLRSSAAALISSSPPTPSFAYLLSGTVGDADRLLRLLRATYHPRNLYLLHLDGAAPQAQRDRLARAVRAVPAFRSAGNVHVIGKSDFANPRGSSALAATLHAAAILLRLGPNWDWFINLHASDYPLVTQDDLLHVFSFLPKDLNFVQHSSYIGWKESQRQKLIIVDPGLYLSSRTEVFYATQKRELPNAYRLFTGSASVILSRKFVEYCILDTDNLPRTLLMYYGNTPSSCTNYFQTVLCNSPEFNRTVVNHDLHYVVWDTSPKKEPHVLTTNDLENMTQSGAAFGTRFARDDPVLDHIDQEVLNCGPSKIVPGGWCLGKGHTDACLIWGNVDVLIPGPGAMRLADFMAQLLSAGTLHSHQCIWD